MDIYETIAAFLETHRITSGTGIVAISGGPDSVALAHAVLRIAVPLRIVLAHVNHQLRGAESDEDERFVSALPNRWSSDRASVRVLRVDTAAEAKRSGQNLEATARDLRYSWFAQVAHEEGAGWVAVAHTADDQAETVLFRLLRGSGVDGLGAMRPRRTLADSIDLVRPLLGLRRKDVLDYLKAESLEYRQDSSNLNIAFTRNRLRRDLIPQLEREYNPAVVQILCRLAEQAREVQHEMRRLAEDLRSNAELPRAGEVLVFRASELATARPQVLREMLRLIWQREQWPMGAMGFDEWHRLVSLVRGEFTACDLPGGIHVRRAGNVLQLAKRR